MPQLDLPGAAGLACTALSLWPLPQAVISLMEMGFDEKEVIDALRVSNNQQNEKATPKGCNKRKTHRNGSALSECIT